MSLYDSPLSRSRVEALMASAPVSPAASVEHAWRDALKVAERLLPLPRRIRLFWRAPRPGIAARGACMWDGTIATVFLDAVHEPDQVFARASHELQHAADYASSGIEINTANIAKMEERAEAYAKRALLEAPAVLGQRGHDLLTRHVRTMDQSDDDRVRIV